MASSWNSVGSNIHRYGTRTFMVFWTRSHALPPLQFEMPSL